MSRNYLDRQELAELVRECHLTGAPSDRLGLSLAKIAGGVWDRFQHTADRDDFVQETVLHLLKTPLRKADPTGNLFSYFTTCAVNFGSKLRDKEQGELRRFRAYAKDRLDSGEEIPERE
ncbi:hypothetical protein R5W23_000850 [Gemmata sp. JC673]|uniref:Sigma-70 family RNA polymerase sigma factor n=1 Tax=Gemmata algarum TaxID=2975278 RepID=A0ABU5ESA8_9BACT|nr:hypothetical protein [Gemmata algarum]MDY3558129.1 hypothetical protein [Gemmata algarum]